MLFDPTQGDHDDPDASQQSLLIIPSAILAALSFSGVVLRLVSRKVMKSRLFLDDYLILFAAFCAWEVAAGMIVGAARYHYGQHLQHSTVDSLRQFFKLLYAFEITYNLAMAFVKYSLLATYSRIFDVPWFKNWLWVGFALNTAWLLATVFCSIFACRPISGFWEVEMPSTCLDSVKYYYGQTVGNVAIDLYVIFLPFFLIPRLKLPRSQKVALSCTFLIGVFVTACSGVRLSQLLSQNQTKDFTWNLVGSGVWSCVETNVAVFVACLPSLRPLLRFMMYGTVKADRSSLTPMHPLPDLEDRPPSGSIEMRQSYMVVNEYQGEARPRSDPFSDAEKATSTSSLHRMYSHDIEKADGSVSDGDMEEQRPVPTTPEPTATLGVPTNAANRSWLGDKTPVNSRSRRPSDPDEDEEWRRNLPPSLPRK